MTCNDSNDEAFPASGWVSAGSLWRGCGLRCASDAAADGAVGWTHGGGGEACGSGGLEVGETCVEQTWIQHDSIKINQDTFDRTSP